MLIVTYKGAYDLYVAHLSSLRRCEKYDKQYMPILKTVDSSMGSEADHVIFDTSLDNADNLGQLGFLRDDERVHVAASRAKEVCWIVGGSMTGRLQGKPNSPHIVDLQGTLARTGHIVRAFKSEHDIKVSETYKAV